MFWSSEGTHFLEATPAEQGNYPCFAETVPDALIEAIKEDATWQIWGLGIYSYDSDNDKSSMTLPSAEDVIQGKKVAFVKPGMLKGSWIDLHKRWATLFQRSRNFPLDCAERETPTFIARVKGEEESFFPEA